MSAQKTRLALITFILVISTIIALTKADPDKPRAAPTHEQKIMNILNDLYNEEYPLTNVPPEDGKLLRILAQSTRAKKIVEIGTANGCSALWFAIALESTGGKLITHEIDDYRAALARKNFEKAGVEKLITIVEGDAHKTVTDLEPPIDILFLDADKKGNLDYLRKLLPKIRPGGLIIAHNTTTHAQDIKPYLDAVTKNPTLQTILLNQQDQGIALTLKKRQP